MDAAVMAHLADLHERVAALERRAQESAEVLDKLAESITYPITPPRVTREQLRALAAILRRDEALQPGR